jgi:copper chaperone CopZ
MRIILTCITAVVMTLCAMPQASAQPDSVKKAVIKVTNLHCGNDMPTIKKQLLNREGIDEVTFTDIARETSVFTITYHTIATTQEQIEQAIESTPGCDDKNSTPYKVKRQRSHHKKQQK